MAPGEEGGDQRIHVSVAQATVPEHAPVRRQGGAVEGDLSAYACHVAYGPQSPAHLMNSR